MHKILVLLMLSTLAQASYKNEKEVEIVHVTRIALDNLPALIASFQSNGDGKLIRTKRISSKSFSSIDFDLDSIPVVSDEDKK